MSLFEKFFGRHDGFVPGTHTYSVLDENGKEVRRKAISIESAKFFINPEAEKLLLKWGAKVDGKGKIIAPITNENHQIEVLKTLYPAKAKNAGLRFDGTYKTLDKIDKYTIDPPDGLTEVRAELRDADKVVVIYKYKNADLIDSEKKYEVFPDPEFPNEAVCVKRISEGE